MKDNFITSMLSENGKISHKRFISIIASIVACGGSGFAILKHPAYIPDLIHSLMIFVCVMSGVATVAQIVTLVRGGTPQKSDEPKPDQP